MDPLLTIEARAGYWHALMDVRELMQRHDLCLTKKARKHILAALDCIMTDPDRFAELGGMTDLYWGEEGKTIRYTFDA